MSSAVVFAYHNVGVRCLSVLLDRQMDIPLVITHQDNPEENLWFQSVARLAQVHGLPVALSDTIDISDLYERIRAIAPDFIFSFYYRHLIPESILQLARLGSYNMHGSLLPQYRGRVPINWAIIHGETHTGATLHRMVARADAGDIVDQETVPICLHDTALDVFQKVTVVAELILHRCLPQLQDGTAQMMPQDLSKGKYYGGRKATDGCIDWRQSALSIHHFVRALTHPYPGAYTDIPQGRLFLWQTIPGYGNPPLSTIDNCSVYIRALQSHIFLICKENTWLRIMGLSLGDIPLTPDNFVEHIGQNTLCLA